MKKNILFLRPFWHSYLSIRKIRRIYQITKEHGVLTILESKLERNRIRIRKEDHQKNDFFQRILNGINPSMELKLIRASDDEWQKVVFEQIYQADVVIFHLAPKDPFQIIFKNIMANPTPQRKLGNLSHNPVHVSGASKGLLLELKYCKQIEALSKAIVIVPFKFNQRINHILALLDQQSRTGIGSFYQNIGGKKFLPLTSELSTLDRSISILQDVDFILPYRNFGGAYFLDRFNLAIHKVKNREHRPIDPTSLVLDIPEEPVPLPPDQRLKNIRFTPIQSLTRVPAGEIAELSFEEVKVWHPHLDHKIKCPKCNFGLTYMFWYKYEIGIQIDESTSIYMLCQHCGNDEYL